MRRRLSSFPKPVLKWTTKKPLTQGRFWWTCEKDQPPTLVYIEKESLGFYVLGVGWLPYQAGQWAGPFGEQDPAGCDEAYLATVFEPRGAGS